MAEAQRGEGWKEVRGALQRDFRFENFREAIAFVNRLAVVAEEVDHHPEIAIRWNLVRIRWRTHAKRAITQRDVEMAKRTGELGTSSHEAPEPSESAARRPPTEDEARRGIESAANEIGMNVLGDKPEAELTLEIESVEEVTMPDGTRSWRAVVAMGEIGRQVLYVHADGSVEHAG